MTAVVGILNKRAVALASDSAVTMQTGKIFNKANKLFTLSKYHPVGVMLHNDAAFMGTPWETIIKEYRQQLGNKSFGTLKEYQQDFLDFIKKQDFFCDADHQMRSLHSFFHGINASIYQDTHEEMSKIANTDKTEFIKTLKENSKKYAEVFAMHKEKIKDFEKYTIEDFEKFIKPKINDVFKVFFEADGYILDDEAKNLLIRAYFNELVVKEMFTANYTGLIFSGFGEKEIFPSLIPIRIFFGFDNKLRFYVDEDKGATITHALPSGICMFAQSDVMETILTGIAPDLMEAYGIHFRKFLDDYEKILINNYPSDDKGDLKYLLGGINKENIMKAFSKATTEVIQNKYVYPLFNAVAALSKEDLAEMAESLIYLTYLQRRITNAQESVGGPVDVAVITKGDGFIWIKRKHYFDPNLNPAFLERYFS